MKTIIREGYAGVLFRKGVFVRALGPGQHRYTYMLGERVEVFDTRIMASQAYGSFATADNVSVMATVPFTYQITDLKAYVTIASSPDVIIRSVTANAVSIAIGGKDLESLEGDLSAFSKAFGDAAAKDLHAYGIEVREVFSPTITIPKNIRNAAEAQVAAKKKALADLEEARGRTAVLRHYANTADLIKDKPEILQLMLSQKAKNIHIDFSQQK